jgi:hypothetical protein
VLVDRAADRLPRLFPDFGNDGGRDGQAFRPD